MHPEQVGPYKIDRKIGAGGMGNVYLGMHVMTGQQAAVKVLPASMAREEGFAERFTREIDVLRQLSNRHIVQLFEEGKTQDGTLYYSMEFVDGVTLTTEITERKRLPWNEVLEISQQIAAALKAAHDAGIVHRDLKPSNLLLTRNKIVKLTDFGVASVFAATRLTRTGGVVGTAEYMSPEQARGQRASRRSDLYSLGAVMYAMLTGRPPFTGQSASEILQKHQFGQYDKPSRYVPEIPRLLEELVCQLLEKDPSKRLPDALVVMRRLEQIRTRLETVTDDLESETIERHAAENQNAAGTMVEQSSQPGPATIVRNMIRDELSSSRVKSRIARFFDNTFVLITLLMLVVVFSLWMHRRSVVDPQERLQTARSLLEKEPGPAWLRARDEYLKPLLESKSLPDSEPEIHRLIEKADQYDFCRSLETIANFRTHSEPELERLIRCAIKLYADGDTVMARQRLQAVLEIARQQPDHEYVVRFLADTLHRWDQQHASRDRIEFLNRLLTEAEAQLRAGKDPAAIVAPLKAAALLYDNDLSVSDQLVRIRTLVQQLDETSASQTTDDSK